jgi:Caspase domain
LNGSRSRSRGWLAAVVAIGCAAIVSVAPAGAADVDSSKMSADAIKALEQRLTGAGCYHGAIDGQTSGALDDAIKACPDQPPFLRIETGMHTAVIRRIGVDAACSLLATASEDKTVRLWSLPDGKPKGLVRLPIGDGDLGKVYATAMSPDGRWLAAGGWDAAQKSSSTYSLNLVDLTNGAIRRFGAFDNVIFHLAFSADGRRIAVGLFGKNGVRVLDSATGAELLADRDYGDDVPALAFVPDGGLIASSYDGQLRRYGADLKLMKKAAAPDGSRPYGVAIDPSGRRIAVGYEDTTSVSILDAKTMMPLAKAQTSDVSNGTLSSVAWSRDGATLVAGGRALQQIQGQWRGFLRRFDAAGQRKGEDVAASDSTIANIQTCGDGFAFAAADPAFGLLSAQGLAKTLQGPHSADMRVKLGSAFALSPDATSARFGLGYGEEKSVLFDIAAASLTDSTILPPEFLRAKIDGLPVTDWQHNTAPKFNGAKLALEDYETSRALAVRGDAPGFALGTDYLVRAYDAKGKEQWRHAGIGIAWGVDFSADGAILAVAYGDGTIRWLRWSDGAELLALFVEPQSRKWVAWTASGYYMASAGGEDLIGWHVNRGWAQAADFFPASQFRAEYDRPDIVRLVLKTRDEAEAVRRANLTADRSVSAKPLGAALPPVVTIVSPAGGARFSGDSVEVAYALRSSSGQPIDRLEAFADGEKIPVAGFRTTSAREAQGRVIVSVPRKSTVVSLITYSGDLPSAPAKVSLVYDGPAVVLLKPKLYALLVGVTGYDNPDYNNIHYSAHDAADLAKALMTQKGGLYADVQVKVINDRSRPDTDPTRSNVENGLYWLQHAATNRDLAVVFLSGHGFLDPKQKFWFLTREADVARLRTTAISNDDLLDLVASIPGKKVLFVDACHSGAAMTVGLKGTDTTPDMNKFVGDFSTAGSGVVVFAASTGTELAKEHEKWDRHGAFAKALIDAIGAGKASIDPSGRITTDMLDLYITDRVKAMTEGLQHPVMNRPVLVPDFPIAIAQARP